MNSIQSVEEYDAALARLLVLIEKDPERGTPEADELNELARVVEAYERLNFPYGLPLP